MIRRRRPNPGANPIAARGARVPDADSPRLVLATDLDGTIAFQGRPPVAAITAVLQRFTGVADVRVAVATSRAPHAVAGWFSGFAHRIDLLCCNGALVLRDGSERARRALPGEFVAAAVRAMDAAGAAYCLEYGDHFLASGPAALPWMGTTHRHSRWPEEIPRWDGVLKISVERGVPWAGRLQTLGAGDVRVFSHGTGDADVVAAGVDKMAALQELVGAGPKVVAFGNDENDRLLLAGAHRAVVIGELLPELDTLPEIRRIEAVEQVIVAALTAELALALGPMPPLWWDEAVS